MANTVIRIRALRDGFRRCGVAHRNVDIDHPLDRFSDEELAILADEPMLTVRVVEIESESTGEADSTGKADTAGDADSIVATETTGKSDKAATKPSTKLK